MAFSKLVAIGASLGFYNSISALPNTGPSKSCTDQPLATFDDIPILNPTGPTNPVGVYRTLNFPGLTIDQTLSTSPTGVVAQSGTRFAVFNLETQVLTASKSSGITVQNDGSTTKSFSISSFYYACAVASQEGLAGVPAACTFIATGFNAAGKVVAQQSFPYTFTSAKQGMTLAKPSSSFSNLYNVTFSLKPTLTSQTLVGLVDSVSLNTCTS